MKVTNIVFAALLLAVGIFAVSCGIGETPKDFLGKWRYAEWKIQGEAVNLADFGNPVITFNNDSTFVVQAGNQVNKDKWYVNGDTLVMLYSDGKSQHFHINQYSQDSARMKSIDGVWDAEMLFVRVKE